MKPEPPAKNAATSGEPRVVGPGDGNVVESVGRLCEEHGLVFSDA
jgi:hypothetical protein